MTTTFYLIRHGETDWNQSGRWQGHADVPLNQVGLAQAQLLAGRLREEGARFDALYSSDLQRAWATARALGAALQLAPRALPALREIDVGSWSGLTAAEVQAQDGENYERIRSGDDLARGGGERFLDLYTRVVAMIERLADEQPGRTLALVTHGGPVRAILMHAARGTVGLGLQRAHIGNTSLSVVIGSRAGWRLGVVNDMAHLAAAPQARDMMSAPPDDAERPQ